MTTNGKHPNDQRADGRGTESWHESPETLPRSADESLALRFADSHKNRLRYTHAWGRWQHFDGSRWCDDFTLLASDYARQICREAAAEAKSAPEAKETGSARKRASVISLAREDRRLAATAEQWDGNPLLLNTPAGVIDLRTFETTAHRPSDYFTKITAIEGRGTCPRWLQFLKEITGGDTQLAEFLQRVAGYALTGLTTEHALFFLYGTGANGKSVFLSTLAGIMGDYHRAAPIEAFTASTGERHPTELAMLRGARLVTAVETEEGRRWAESRIKTLTGGDKVTARFMRQDFFEFSPQFKLIIAGNHKPSLRTVDEAIRRRFHLIPFTITISPEDRDPNLAEKLRKEWPGILLWALDGCAAWQETGLTPPPAVTAATAAYLEAEDALGAWTDEECELLGEEALSVLYASWRQWAETNGEPPRTNKWLSQALEARGFDQKKTMKGKVMLGIRSRRGTE